MLGQIIIWSQQLVKPQGPQTHYDYTDGCIYVNTHTYTHEVNHMQVQKEFTAKLAWLTLAQSDTFCQTCNS